MNKNATDPLDKLIFEKGLRARHYLADKKLGLMVIVLNNGEVLRVSLADFRKLAKCSQAQLDKGRITDNGVAISWDEINEDISLKGLIQSAFYSQISHETANIK